MPTTNYALPTVATSDQPDGASQSTALANATDAALSAFVAAAVRRVMANGNTFTNQTTYAVFPDATDRTAMTVNFTKAKAGTKLVLHVDSTSQFTSGVAQTFWVGLRIGGTDYDVGMWRSLIASIRNRISGIAVVTGLAAGAYTIEPVFRAEGASGLSFNATHDFVSWEVHETW